MKYSLFDLRITTEGNPSTFNCSHIPGEGLIIEGENFRLLSGTDKFSYYAFATIIPYVAAKQRANDDHDWMYYESTIACPDPKCGAFFKFTRIMKSEYEYGGE